MKKILVVDDEETIRFLYQEELGEEGYAVEVAANGQEALDKLNTFHPDLITLDIKMPAMDGVETLRRIREVQRDLPVILCIRSNGIKGYDKNTVVKALISPFENVGRDPECIGKNGAVKWWVCCSAGGHHVHNAGVKMDLSREDALFLMWLSI